MRPELGQRPVAVSDRQKLGAAAGIVGPVVFTAAWIVSSLRQTGYPASAVQISGLAAPDARDPWIMIVGLLVLGVGTVVLGAALRRALGGARRSGPGPRLVQLCGVATVCAGLLRRDRMAVGPPSLVASESWHNHAHDLASVLIYLGALATPMFLARRFRGDRCWSVLRRPMLLIASGTLVTMVVFFVGVVGSYNGVLQLIAVSLPLIATLLVALRLFAVPRTADPDG
jgi:hypothetical membrane protein